MRNVGKIIFVLVVWLLGGCSRNNELNFTGSGTIEATEVTVSSQTLGEVKELLFDEGTSVQLGDTLAKIDAESLILQRKVTASGLNELSWNEKVIDSEMVGAQETVNQVSATLLNVQKTYERFINLLKDGSATQDNVDKAGTELAVNTSKLKAAENQLTILKAQKSSIAATRDKITANLNLLDYQIEKTKIVSPTSGVVIDKFVEKGELVSTGTPICSIADLSSVWLTVYVGEEQFGTIRLGEKAKIRIDSMPDKTFKGIVTWISQRAEFTPKNVQTKESRIDLVYAVKITIDNHEGVFKIGMPADAYLGGQ